MSNVIRFLESMGSEAQWNSISKDDMTQALADAGVEDPLRSAILNKDAAQLQALLQQKPLMGYIEIPEIPGEGDEEEEDDSDQEPGEKDARQPSSCPSATAA